MITAKTAVLFAAACEVAGVVAGYQEEITSALDAYGRYLGIAFQLVDDVLDYQGDTEDLGKNVGDDFRERKLTLPVIKAVAKADEDERAFWKRTIEKGDQQDGDLEQALALIAKHGTMETTRAQALEWSATAKTALDVLPDHPLRDMLRDLADYVVARIS